MYEESQNQLQSAEEELYRMKQYLNEALKEVASFKKTVRPPGSYPQEVWCCYSIYREESAKNLYRWKEYVVVAPSPAWINGVGNIVRSTSSPSRTFCWHAPSLTTTDRIGGCLLAFWSEYVLKKGNSLQNILPFLQTRLKVDEGFLSRGLGRAWRVYNVWLVTMEGQRQLLYLYTRISE